MRILVCLYFFIIVQSCTNEKNGSYSRRAIQESQEIPNDSSLNEEYYSYYGFIVANSNQHNFYCLERKVMLKYISNIEIDSTTIKKDILSAAWFSPIIGTSFDYFAWRNFIETNLKSRLDLEFCGSKTRSLIIPVYITQFNRNFDNAKAKRDSCGSFFPSGVSEQRRLNLVYVIPLNYEMANKFLFIRDTLDREKYKVFLQNRIH